MVQYRRNKLTTSETVWKGNGVPTLELVEKFWLKSCISDRFAILVLKSMFFQYILNCSYLFFRYCEDIKPVISILKNEHLSINILWASETDKFRNQPTLTIQNYFWCSWHSSETSWKTFLSLIILKMWCKLILLLHRHDGFGY